ncbi:hydrophobe/amphiphile efflux-1 family RND transporter [Flectobacillus sp. BAB-3569]|nr:hydrophobe/amphiphile efflux-1 family RND transporter [Flectobacillus sp. BAB-3569]
METLSKSFPPGIGYYKLMSTKDRLDEATGQVKHTLIEAFILVFIVVLLFLQDFRSTIIPAIAVPVAIIGTFFFLMVLGFTINILTLFALVLAIGIVVDDAIVVVEAVHSKMEGTNLTGREATHSAMSEITGAVISITLVMSAVFIPIGFMSGAAGIFYKQFAYTLAIAIIISAVNALTLTPALCALFLKNTHAEGHHSGANGNVGFGKRFTTAFNVGFNSMTNRYIKGIVFLINRKWLATSLVIITIVVAAVAMYRTPKSFVPLEDDGFFVYSLSMPPGTGLSTTTEVAQKINNVLKEIEAIEENTSITGFNMLNNSASSAYGTGFIKLKSKDKRGEIKDIDQIMQVVDSKLSEIKEGSVYTFRQPPVDGYGSSNGAEIVLQDLRSQSPQKLVAQADSLIYALMGIPDVQMAYTTFRADYPQLELEVNEDKAKQLGVSISGLLRTIQTYFSGDQSQDFIRFGKFYRVNIKADGIFRMDEQAFKDIFVKNIHGQMVAANTLVSLHKVYGPEAVSRYNMFNALTINITPKPGVSNGQLMQSVEYILDNRLPSDFKYEWTGLSLEEKSTGNQAILILGLCLLFVYLLLSAQYESYLLPLAVLLSIPTGVIGAFLGIMAVGLDNNIYVQVGIIMLIGLLAKNAILIVEFAVQRRRAGFSIVKSAIDGAQSRLRPIIMTSLAFIAGMIPLVLSAGSTAVGNKSISVSTATGMLTGVILGIFVIPLLYIVFQFLQDKLSGKKQVV